MAFDITRAHEIYDKRLRRWEMAYDFWLGGLNVLAPSSKQSMYNFRLNTTDSVYSAGGLEPVQEGSSSQYNWSSGYANSYLWKHEREPDHSYKQRCERIINIPLFQHIINSLTGAALNKKPTRSGNDQYPWNLIHTDVDFQGSDIDALERRVFAYGAVFGRCHTITDKPYFENTPRSRREQIERRERAYTKILLPFDLIDWSVDEYDEFNWCVIRECAPDTRSPGLPDEGEKYQYKIWTRNDWTIIRLVEKKYEPVLSGVHGLGFIPINTFYCGKTAEPGVMDCESPMADFLDINRYQLNKLSELDELERGQTFSILAVPSIDQGIKQIDISPFAAFKYPSDAGEPKFLSPDPQHPQGKWQRIQEMLQASRQFASISRGKAEYSKEERSASAIALESEDKRNMLAWWIKSLDEFDQKLHNTISAWEQTSTVPTAIFDSNFDMRLLSAQLNDLILLFSTNAIPEITKHHLIKPLLNRVLVEVGADSLTASQAMESFENEPVIKPSDAMETNDEPEVNDDPV